MMDPYRRRLHRLVLGSATTAVALPPLRIALAGETIPLTARVGTARLAPAGHPETSIWGFDGTVPGPGIRTRQGSTVRRQFINQLPEPTSVHWHGIRLANNMDGVAGMTQPAVPPGDTFQYEFLVPDAGTFWYHSHNRSWEQVARGLYGPLIIEEAEQAPDVDGEYTLLLDDWRLTDDAQVAGGFGNLHDWSHAGRIGNWITVNGHSSWSEPTLNHGRYRLRLVNASNARVFRIGSRGMATHVMALDGMPLQVPEQHAQFTLAPGQRIDLLADIMAGSGGEAMLTSAERRGTYVLASFPVTGSVRARQLQAPVGLPPNPVPPLGKLADVRRIRLLMQGGAMGRLDGALLNGKMADRREMARAGKVWAFNGMADMPDAPLADIARGETVLLEMINSTAWPHAMHLHGHHFRRVGDNDNKQAPGPLRDTLLVNRNQTVTVAFVADNPGDWLVHCHMLEHAAGGMMTWLRVRS